MGSKRELSSRRSSSISVGGPVGDLNALGYGPASDRPGQVTVEMSRMALVLGRFVILQRTAKIDASK
jgi:hypothetical protein